MYFCGLKEGNDIAVDIQKGKTVHIKMKTIGLLDSTGHREVFFELNGQPRSLYVACKEAASSSGVKERADKGNDGSVGAPMPGEVVGIRVEENQQVVEGDPLVVLSAMKMETVVGAPISGRVKRLVVKQGDTVWRIGISLPLL